MSRARTIVVVRHGRTASNAAGLLLGRADPPLDDVGLRQAGAAGAAVAALVPAGTPVVSSPLRRCRATAEAVAGRLGGAEVEVDERWIELDYGELEGVPVADVPAATWAAWRSDADWRPPGGETHAELGRRVRAACDELAAGEGPVVVVTHVSPVKAAVAWALGVGDAVTWRLYVAPASITTIAVRDGTPTLQAFNVTAHCDPPAGPRGSLGG